MNASNFFLLRRFEEKLCTKLWSSLLAFETKVPNSFGSMSVNPKIDDFWPIDYLMLLRFIAGTFLIFSLEKADFNFLVPSC